MKNLKKYAGILVMLTLLVGFTSCEDDEDIFDDLVGRTWVGDLGFGSDEDPIESSIQLDDNGMGIDYQRYYNGGRPGNLAFQWGIEHGTLILDYGAGYGFREIDNVHVDGRYLYGDLFIDGEYFDAIELRMN